METDHLKPVIAPQLSLYSHRQFSAVPTENRGGSVDSKSTLSDIPVQSVGHDVEEAALMRHGHVADFPVSKFSDYLKPNVLDTVPAHSLFSTMNRILDESIEKTNENVPHRVARLLKKVLQAIEGRTSTQHEFFRNKINVYKNREEKYNLRLKALELLSSGTNDENEVVMNQLKHVKVEKLKVENEKKLEGMEMVNLLEEKANRDAKITLLNHDIEEMKEEYEKSSFILNSKAKKAETELEMQLKERDALLSQMRKENKKNKSFFETATQKWNEKEHQYLRFTDYFLRALQELKTGSEAVKRDVLKAQRSHSNDASRLGSKVKGLVNLVENYNTVLAENRRLYNEVQDLKGNIRVYCRIRPFLPGQNKKQTTIEYVGDNGELFIAKQGKENRRPFKFNKVFGQDSTQEEVFLDTQPLIRSVLDGFNVCIFAYGQTGSGKTYTMSGAEISSKEHWGVNYRALNDLFLISQSRMDCIKYEVGVQMVEIYNEQVRDLLSVNNQKRLEILSTAQPNGFVVPNASMHPVKSTRDVMDLMNNGLMNRAVGATALNDRSSRSHSVLTVHVRGVDMETDATLKGNLHLVDLAGSERVLRSEATGERLREAQHINKSLSALGDVIFALAQKSPHVPYRNSKLTQLLQSSLGGQAKTLMFVQLNPDVDSYSETVSTLKFAERVSGVELGAARSSKEGKDVRSLMDQISSLKDQISVKDGEIEQLKMMQRSPSVDLLGIGATKFMSSPRRHSLGTPREVPKPSDGKWSRLGRKVASDLDNCSECSGEHSEAGSQQSGDELRHKNNVAASSKPKFDENNVDQNGNEDVDLLGFGDDDSEERLSDISDGGLSMGTETDVSTNSVVEFTLFPESAKKMEHTDKSSVPTKLPRPPQKLPQSRTTTPLFTTRSSSRVLRSVAHSAAKKGVTGGSSSAVRPGRRWQ